MDTLAASTAKGYNTKASSPWSKGFPGCYWPVDESVTTLCNIESPKTYDAQSYRCYRGDVQADWRWCGSDFDYYGNRRFEKGPQVPPYLDKSIYTEDLLWGFMTFDNLARALLTIFQSVTMEAWSDIMYMCMDSSGFATAGTYFVLLMLLGSFFALNLVLAVLENAFDQEEEEDGDEDEPAAAEEPKSEANTAGGLEAGGEASAEASVEENGSSRAASAEDMESGAPIVAVSVKDGLAPPVPASQKYEMHGAEVQHAARTRGPPAILERISLWVQDENGAFSWFITLLIVVNTVVLAMDKYPSTTEYDQGLGVANEILTWAFAGEMVLKLAVMGPGGYVKDRFNVFDAIVVFISFLEYFMSEDAGGLTALRSFRLFRIFKLARKWHTMQRLLQLIVTTLVDVSNFLLLVCLFIFIYAMLGIEFFANRMRFDEQGHAIPIGGEGYDAAYVPRHNFDTVLNAVVTVYQILSGENWNVVMYDGWRATSWVATLYFVSLVVFGALFVMNLFLAILLNNFDVDESGDAPAEEPGANGKRQDTVNDDSKLATAMASPAHDARVHPSADSSDLKEGPEVTQNRDDVSQTPGSAVAPASSLSRVSSSRQPSFKLHAWIAGILRDIKR